MGGKNGAKSNEKTSKQDPSRHDALKQGASNHDTSKHEAAIHDATKNEAAKHEVINYDTSKHDVSKHDASKHDASKYDVSKHKHKKHAPDLSTKESKNLADVKNVKEKRDSKKSDIRKEEKKKQRIEDKYDGKEQPKSPDNASKFRKMIKSIKDADHKGKPCKKHGYSVPLKVVRATAGSSQPPVSAHSITADKKSSATNSKHLIERPAILAEAAEPNVFAACSEVPQSNDRSAINQSKKSILKSNCDLNDKLSKMRSNIKFDKYPTTWNSVNWFSPSTKSITNANQCRKSSEEKSKLSQGQYHSILFAKDRGSLSPVKLRLSKEPQNVGKVESKPLPHLTSHHSHSQPKTEKDRRASKTSVAILSKFNQIYDHPEILNQGAGCKRSMLSLLQKQNINFDAIEDGKPRLSVCHAHKLPERRPPSVTTTQSESLMSDFDAISLISTESATTDGTECTGQHSRMSLHSSDPDSNFPAPSRRGHRSRMKMLSTSESSGLDSSSSSCSGMFSSNVRCPSSRMDMDIMGANRMSDSFKPKYRMGVSVKSGGGYRS